ncbi:protein necessary for structural stability of L-A double-stranded RNA-containing particles [Scheffersomyces amazonensis]|uniref:protein necessary for structural stability of L-A double-stranded RNA-containing particles n=1 Tax=Scheffersomyces amazonensis TaxID=1078765 RepID=UPI00315D633C
MSSLPPILTSMGMFIIDENLYPESWNRPSEHDILGGGGPYAIVGGRIVAGHKEGKRITGIIDKGNDFPNSVALQLNSWDTGIIYRQDNNRFTTRGQNIYDENDIRHFKYTTTKKRIEVEDILNNEILKQSRCFHLICSIERCGNIIDELNSKLSHKPIYIYEPLPDDCKHENLSALEKLLPKINIFTPNLDEACEFLGTPKQESINSWKLITNHFNKYLKLINSGTVLRCGPLGCYIQTLTNQSYHLPAYHLDQNKVIDVTGGGNSFCGAFVTAFYLSNGNWLLSGILGNLASGCIIEKLGPPIRNASTEEWNGLSIQTRFNNYILQNQQLVGNLDNSILTWI